MVFDFWNILKSHIVLILLPTLQLKAVNKKKKYKAGISQRLNIYNSTCIHSYNKWINYNEYQPKKLFKTLK